MNIFLYVIRFYSIANLFLAWVEGGCALTIKIRQLKMGRISNLKVPLVMITNLKRMNNKLHLRMFSLFLSIVLTFCPSSLDAVEIDSSAENSLPIKIEENCGEMTQKQMNDLFGEDPYLGQTSYLQSPDGFSQRENSK